jgi:hypothetical protein
MIFATTKANLWVWNAPRGGFPGAPVNQEVVERNKKANKVDDSQKKATFRNSESDERFRNAKLYFQDTYWGDLGFGDDALHVNTYEGKKLLYLTWGALATNPMHLMKVISGM